MIKLIFRTALFIMFAVGFAACDKDNEEPVVYETVNYATINGTWMLTELNGKALEEGQYVYITFNRKEHTFEMYDNMGSMYSHKSTGTFEITEDDELGYVLTGEYDFSRDRDHLHCDRRDSCVLFRGVCPRDHIGKQRDNYACIGTCTVVFSVFIPCRSGDSVLVVEKAL